MTVIELKKGYNSQAVDLLEELLIQAKAGDITQLVVLAQSGNEYNQYYTGTDSIPEVIGQLTLMIDKQIRRSRDVD